MKPKCLGIIIFFIFFLMTLCLFSDQRDNIYRIGVELEEQAAYLAQSSYDHFRGRDGALSDKEQAVLFKSEAFSASCRLFLKLTEESTNYYRSGYLRTNLFSAFVYLVDSFKELENEMDRAGVRPYTLNQCRRILDSMEHEFSRWPSADNLAYLHRNYVKARNATVYWIERISPGEYIRHPFKDLESIFKFNYELNRGNDPWKYLKEVPYDTLDKMDLGDMTELTFEGFLVIENTTRPHRPVYLIENGKKRGITSPAVLDRFGGWNKVYEIPAEIISKYPEGEPIK